MNTFNPGLSVILGNVGACSDRYVGEGYSKGFSVDELFERVGAISGVTGIELVGTWHIRPDNVESVRRQMKDRNLKMVAIIPDHFGTAYWGKGAFTSTDPGVRREAERVTLEMADIVSSLGGDLISLWPGQDGYDYPWQADYAQRRQWMEDGIAACAKARPDIRFAIEYKPKEPRNRSYASNISSAILMAQATSCPNVGITIDYGHALTAYENVAESVAIAAHYGGLLYHLHMNDAYGYWDDDMICGTIHTIPYLELFYWLKKTGYNGWISTDQYPYREDGKDAVEESVRWMEAYIAAVNRMDEAQVEALLASGDAVAASRWMRGQLFPK